MASPSPASILFSCAVAVLGPTFPVAAQTAETVLVVGPRVEREMTGQGAVRFPVRLEDGTYLDVVVEQKGVDVVVSLVGPSGEKLLEFDSPNGANGPEPMKFVATAPGTYAVEVRSLDAAAKGRFSVEARAIRPATDADRAVADALAAESQSITLLLDGRTREAIPPAERAVALYERALGPDHPDVVRCVKTLANLYNDAGMPAKAEPLFARALASDEKALGPSHPDVATDLNNLGLFYTNHGAFAKAEPLLTRALAIGETALGPNHPSNAATVNNLAELYRATGAYAKAEPLYARALRALESDPSSEPGRIAAILNNLSLLYQAQGAYAKAEAPLERAVAGAEKALGPNHPTVLTLVNNLAQLEHVRGAFEKEEPLAIRAATTAEKVLGPDHPTTGTTLNNLGLLYLTVGKLDRAEPLLVRALSIAERALGPDHPNALLAVNNLALLYERRGDPARAEPLYLRALAGYEHLYGRDHPDVGRALVNLAACYDAQRDYAKADAVAAKALATYERSVGPDHPYVAAALGHLSTIRFEEGDVDAALALDKRASDVRETELRRNLVAGSADDKRAYLRQLAYETNFSLTYAAAYPTSVPALRNACEQVLRRKGRALDAFVDQLATLGRSGSAEDKQAIADLTAARAAYARLTLGGAGATALDRHRAELDTARARLEALEARVSERSARLRAELSPVTLDAVAHAIPPDAALVEYAVYTPRNVRERTDAPPRYVAFALDASGVVRWADLGDAAEIDALVAALRSTLRPGPGGALPDAGTDVKPRARALDAKIFEPVRALVGDTKRLLVAPDGQLSLVPFDALVDERDRYAVKRYEISYLTSGRDLLRLTAKGPSRGVAQVIADPDFGAAGEAVPAARMLVHGEPDAAAAAPPPGVLARAFFPALPGTAAEADALRRLMPDASVVTGSAATKTAVLAVSGPRVLHIATHGFFLGTARAGAVAGRYLVQDGATSAPAGSDPGDPLLLSGLALAGANLHRGGDAILTSLEAAGLDLWGTKLVVLSACDTGVGEVRNGDGVYGLRRALVLAGSETQVMSLWPVSDAGTRDFMISYYERLADGDGRSRAMRAIRKRFLKSDRFSHPYYWASFIVSGEWANLDGNR